MIDNDIRTVCVFVENVKYQDKWRFRTKVENLNSWYYSKRRKKRRRNINIS